MVLIKCRLGFLHRFSGFLRRRMLSNIFLRYIILTQCEKYSERVSEWMEDYKLFQGWLRVNLAHIFVSVSTETFIDMGRTFHTRLPIHGYVLFLISRRSLLCVASTPRVRQPPRQLFFFLFSRDMHSFFFFLSHRFFTLSNFFLFLFSSLFFFSFLFCMNCNFARIYIWE